MNVLILLGWITLTRLASWHDAVLSGFLGINISYLAFQVFPFTPFAPKQLYRSGTAQPGNAVSLFIGNVYQHNKQAQQYIQCIQSVQPDMIMLVETDEWWAEQVKVLEKDYPYSVLVPMENTYGMLLYSRFELPEAEVKFLVEKDIPSIHSTVKLPSGKLIRFFGLHPTPPVPNENPRSTERDKEILLAGKMAKQSNIPVIVAGDLNDVAWSYTTQLFSKISGLLDPRRGRGFFNTFHAKYPGLRFPLDHIFCSSDFTLLQIKRMSNCGSDHFPMFIKLQIEPKASLIQEEPRADQEDLELAQEKISKPT